jgi:hypothetical protein
MAEDGERDELTWEDMEVNGSPYDFQEIPVGEEVWVPASFKRSAGFRAVKIKVVDRASVGTYEEDCALDEWDTDVAEDTEGD